MILCSVCGAMKVVKHGVDTKDVITKSGNKRYRVQNIDAVICIFSEEIVLSLFQIPLSNMWYIFTYAVYHSIQRLIYQGYL